MRVPSRWSAAVLAVLAFVGGADCVGAQDAGLAPRWELRADATTARVPAAHAGVGLGLRAGPYARVGVALAAGAARGPDDAWRASRRADFTARFLLDPYAERRVGVYGGAGVSARRDGDGPVAGAMVLVLGVEGRAAGALVPSVELSLGGGLRVGVVLRAGRDGLAR